MQLASHDSMSGFEAFPSQRSRQRRRIGVGAGKALEILGHAIDYLTDDYIEAQGSVRDCKGQLQAIQLLMGLNRSIFLSCPVEHGVIERFAAFWHRIFEPASASVSAPSRRF